MREVERAQADVAATAERVSVRARAEEDDVAAAAAALTSGRHVAPALKWHKEVAQHRTRSEQGERHALRHSRSMQ